MGYLSTLLLIPVAGVVVVAALPSSRPHLLRWTAITAALASLGWAAALLSVFDPAIAGIQFFESHLWNPRMGESFALGIDGISYPMVLLATLLTVIALVASASITTQVKAYYILVLLLEAAMLGVFTAQDWVLFYLFWELTLIPLFFLIDRWGGSNRHRAALNFVLYTMGGSVFMLISILVLFDALPNHSFAMAQFVAGAGSLPEHLQILIFLGFLIGFGVKMPIFPMHGWLPQAHVVAPSPISILLSGVLLKMGAYGLLRATEMLPAAVVALQELLLTLAMINLVYGGLLAWKQHDLKSMIAYSSVSHMGVILLGIATLNLHGLTGAVLQMSAHGLAAAALFLVTGLLYERTHTRDVTHYHSLIQVTPRFAFFTTLAFIAAVGMPGTFGFVAELHTLIGGFDRWGWIIVLLTLGVLISATYAIRTIGRLFTGPKHESLSQIDDLSITEVGAISVLMAGAIIPGLYPGPVVQLSSSTLTQFAQQFLTQ